MFVSFSCDLHVWRFTSHIFKDNMFSGHAKPMKLLYLRKVQKSHYYFFFQARIYDGASVKAEKKYLNFFSPPFFQKTAEKKYLNLFSPTFFPKQQKK